MEGKSSGVSFRIFGSTSRGCHKIAENRNNQKTWNTRNFKPELLVERRAPDCSDCVLEELWRGQYRFKKAENADQHKVNKANFDRRHYLT